jgi:hypothetical protein
LGNPKIQATITEGEWKDIVDAANNSVTASELRSLFDGSWLGDGNGSGLADAIWSKKGGKVTDAVEKDLLDEAFGNKYGFGQYHGDTYYRTQDGQYYNMEHNV